MLFEFARDIEVVCPTAWLLNYTNPMAMLTGAMLRGTNVRTVGPAIRSRSVRPVCSSSSGWPTR